MKRRPPRILVTAFEPFDDTQVNSSQCALHALRRRGVRGVELKTCVLPVDQIRGPRALIHTVERTRPDAVVCTGQSERRSAISIERLAINLLDLRKPDNAGRKVSDRPIERKGPAAYFVTLPARAILRALHKARVPAQLSQDAGSYLCNQVCYALLHHLAAQERAIPAGFIHLPALPEQVAARSNGPSMGVETLVAGLDIAIRTIRSTLQS